MEKKIKEIKEIPFGSKDSELNKFEYTIPEGYEARIEDGKVIMTKKESDDERIRKGLLEIFNKAQIGEWGKLKIKDIIVWLEKQKEQKPAEWSDEEKKHLYNAIEAVKYVYDVSEGTSGFKCVEFLKSLRPQPHWKPSEEQMEALEQAKISAECGNFFTKDGLKSLYEQLKKL